MTNFDFHNDLKNEIVEILSEAGIKISLKQNIQNILIDFLNLQSKILESKKRYIYIIPSFESQIDKHYKKREIQTIINYAKNGENLNCFQTDKIIQSKQLDHLSNEWNIYHFHLSLEPSKKPKFVKRGDLLLFAYIDNENIVFLGTEKHKNSFSDIYWLEVLEINFPFLLEDYKAQDLPDIKKNFNTSERKKLWECGISSGFMNINGRTYLSPGIGKVGSGHNVKVIYQSNSILNWISFVTEIVQKNKDDFFNNIDSLKLKITKKNIIIIDKKNKKTLFKFSN